MKWEANRERNERIIEAFHRLKSTRAVSNETGVNLKTVAYTLNQAGIKTPRKGRRNVNCACDRNADLVMQMYNSGSSLANIARTVGTKGQEVTKFLRRNGITAQFSTATYGEKHYAWKGGRLVDKDGYILVQAKNHPFRRKHTPYILEHRLVMEESLGRMLLPTEVVHHIDGNKQNNSIENLTVFACNADHLAFELKGRVPNWSDEGKQRLHISRCRPRKKKRASSQIELGFDDSRCIEIPIHHPEQTHTV